VSVGDAPVEDEVEESITSPIAIPVYDEASETDATEVAARGRRRVPSTPQPLSASELPPPPEQPRLADGEPEPILETFDTGPIDLGTPEATALIAETATIPPEPEPEPEDDEPELPVAVESAHSEDELEEIELDELVEIDDAELEVLDDLDEPENPLPKPPRRQQAPVRTGNTASVPVLEQPPVRSGDTAVGAAPATDEDEPEDVDLDAPRGGDDDFDMDMDDD
jgi:hypothetical protein